MIVFKSYLKICKSYLPVILMFTGIFMAFAVLSTVSNQTSGTTFQSSKPKIAIFNHDSNSRLTNHFIDYLEKNAKIIDVKNDEESQKDALFYREVDMIITIPSNFSQELLRGNNPMIDTQNVPDSYDSTYAEMLINQYLNSEAIYAKSGMNETEIPNHIEADLKVDTKVTVLKGNTNQLEKVNYFYNFANYTLLAVSIFIIGMTMATYRDPKIKRRNLVGSLSYRSINRQLFLGNICLTLMIWLLYVVLSIILYGKTMMTPNGLLMILNSFIFSIAALSIGFLLGSIVKDKNSQNGIVNVIALGTSFISGAFVPQALLSNFVLGVAKFFPSYWYINTNDHLTSISVFTKETLLPVIQNMAIILAFALFFFVITMVITKHTRKDS